jgi:SAM-dependent methyltransferase
MLPKFVDRRLKEPKKVMFYLNPLALRRDRLERVKYEKQEKYSIPPFHLRKRIGADAVEEFLSSGRHCYDDIRNILKSQGKSIEEFNTILDFGCGCGRTLRWFDEWAKKNVLTGVDVDDEVVNWCKANIPFASVFKSKYNPPLPFESNIFDFIYSLSVFSHLEEDLHLQWLAELERILIRGGYAVISTHGPYCYKPFLLGEHRLKLPDDEAIPDFAYGMTELDEKGFIFHPIDIKTGYGTTFISSGYIHERWSNYFEVVDIIPVGMDHLQDTIILQKR